MIIAQPWALYNEIDEYAAEWLENLIGIGAIAPGIVDRRSIADICPDELRGFRQCHFFAGIGVWSYALRRAGVTDDTALWTGSCPCQPFSAAGKGGGVDDERHLWPHWHHHIRSVRPPRIYGEQVASLDGLGWLNLICSDMEAEDYAIWPVDTCSAGSGAPHIRQRLRFYSYDLRSDPVGLVNTNNARLERRGFAGRECANELAVGSDGMVDILADAIGQQHEERLSGLREGDRSERSGQTVELAGLCVSDGLADNQCGQPGPTNGFWRDADWLFCRDGKWRPVEPFTLPLVDGSAFHLGSGSAFEGKSRQGMLKAYGNAIDAEATVHFITAIEDALRDRATIVHGQSPLELLHSRKRDLEDLI